MSAATKAQSANDNDLVALDQGFAVPSACEARALALTAEIRKLRQMVGDLKEAIVLRNAEIEVREGLLLRSRQSEALFRARMSLQQEPHSLPEGLHFDASTHSPQPVVDTTEEYLFLDSATPQLQ